MQELKIGDFVDFISVPEQAEAAFRISDTSYWYCATVRAGCHRRAEFELAQLGYRTFYPRLKRWVSHARTKKAKEFPILGRYVFVEIDHPWQSFATVNSVFEIESLVTSYGQPVAFPRREVETLMSRYLSGEWDEVAKGPIPVGARIRIVEGEFNDLLATVTGSKGRRLKVNVLGRKSETLIHECSARAA